MNPSPPGLRYLSAYPPELLAPVRQLIALGSLGETLARRYPGLHEVRTDGALYDYVARLKGQFMRNSGPLSRVVYDNTLQALRNALGTHTLVSRVQGGRLKAKREIRIAGVFREAPAAFLRMIVVHELAHLKEPGHGKAFHSLCIHMEPAYHQLEFDVRLWLTARELESPRTGSGQPPE